MKRMLALAAAVALIAPLFWSSLAYAGDKNKKKLGKDGPAQQQPQTPPGVIDVGPTIALEEAVGKLKKGETTMEEALALLGQPQVPAMMNGPNGGLTLMYHWRKQLQGGYSMSTGQMLTMSLPGPFQLLSLKHSKEAKAKAEAQMAAVQHSFKSLTLIFDGEGKLKQWVSHPLILPKGPPKNATTDEKDKKSDAPPTESPPLAAVQPPR